MRILLVKTSSLGDVIHNLPVASDLVRRFPGVVIDWVVEAPFADIPMLHPAVHATLPIALRRWRKQALARATWHEIGAARDNLRRRRYDAVLDTQGLLKSALVACTAHGPRLGYAGDSAREPLASRFYHQRFSVSRQMHAVDRNRALAAKALGYTLDDLPLDYGVEVAPLAAAWLPAGPYAVLLTATSRDDKLWPETDWLALGQQLAQRGLRCVLPAGAPGERARAERIARSLPDAVVAPSMTIRDLAALLTGARVAIGVDTGLTHLAAAVGTPVVAIYTATDPGLTGVLGPRFHRNLGGKGQPPGVAAVLQAVTEAMD